MKQSVHIEAPVDTVFDSFKDPAKFWDLTPFDSQLDDVKVTKEGVGTYTSWHARIYGLPLQGFSVYTDVIPDKHITERSSNPLVGTWAYDFEPEGSGTKLTAEHHSESFWRMRLLSAAIDLITERASATFMARVKDAIETQSKVAPAPSA